MRPLALLRLFQVFDSQFPVGAFVHSGGLETYAQQGAGEIELRELMASQIELGWGRGDLAAAALAWQLTRSPRAADLLERLSLEVDAFKVIGSVRDASLGLGRRTLSLLHRIYADAMASLQISRPHHAVVVGAAGCRLELPRNELLLAFAQSSLVASLTAATRCMPISPGQAQALLVELQPSLIAAVERVLVDPGASLFSCTPALDIRCHQQTFLRTRLFQS